MQTTLTKKTVFLKSISLIMCTLIWGVSFVAQSEGMKHIGPFTFTFARFLLATLVLLPLFFYKLIQSMRKNDSTINERGRETLPLKAGLINGVLMFFGVALQQIALQTVSPGKAAFITATYIIWVPLIGMFLGRQNSKFIWLAVLLAAVGLYFLSLYGETGFAPHDLILLACALFFAIQIIVIAKYSPHVENVSMTTITFAVCAILAFVLMLFTEPFSWVSVKAAFGNIAYAGILSSAVAQIFQVYGQDGYHPAIASLLLSLESAMSVLAAWIILGTRLTTPEAVGCVLMFAAILLAQIPSRKPAVAVAESDDREDGVLK